MGIRIPASEPANRTADDASAYAYAQWVLNQRGIRNPTSAQIRLVAARSVELTFGDRRLPASEDLFEAIGA